MDNYSGNVMGNPSIPQLTSPYQRHQHFETECCAAPLSSRQDNMLGMHDVMSLPVGDAVNSPDWHNSAGFTGPRGHLTTNNVPLRTASSSPHLQHQIPPSITSNPESTTPSSLPPLCAGCRLQIVDKFDMCSVEAKWHTSCLKCAECGVELENQLSCFERDGKIYCKDDYVR